MRPSTLVLGLVALSLFACRSPSSSTSAPPISDAPSPSPSLSATPLPARPSVPTGGAIGHVFLIVLENEDLATTFRPGSKAPFLAETLVAEGAFLSRYYGIGHNSLDNYIALVSGQGPNPVTQQDCLVFEDWKGTGPDPARDGQAIGRGCVYPKSVPTLVDQLESAALARTWKGYMEDMGNEPAREARTCGHPEVDHRDGTQSATKTDQYAARHNPFVYFHSIIDDQKRCDEHVVPLDRLEADLATVATTPSFVFITPNLCHDGHDGVCASGEPAGLVAIDLFLRKWVPKILASPAYREDGMLVVTFDESGTPYSDSTACCGEGPTPNVDKPGIVGMGGGKTGAVVLSSFVKPGTVSAEPYNHYSLLRTFEDLYGVPPLGYAASAKGFGADVFTERAPAYPAR